MFGVCEQELMWLEMSLRVKKSSCIPTGARYSATCCNIVNTEGQELSWVTEVRYLGVFIEAASSFKCSLDNTSGPSVVPLILFLGELAEWLQTRLLYSCSNQSAYLYSTTTVWRHALCVIHNNLWILLLIVYRGKFLTLTSKIV